MEIQKVIEFLTERRAIINETIVCLERLGAGTAVGSVPVAPAKRRGRKFMDAGDRLKVSARMKEYWASQRVRHAGSAIESGGGYSADKATPNRAQY